MADPVFGVVTGVAAYLIWENDPRNAHDHGPGNRLVDLIGRKLGYAAPVRVPAIAQDLSLPTLSEAKGEAEGALSEAKKEAKGAFSDAQSAVSSAQGEAQSAYADAKGEAKGLLSSLQSTFSTAKKEVKQEAADLSAQRRLI